MNTASRAGWYHGWNIVAAGIACSVVASALTINCFTLFVVGWAAEMHTPVSSLHLALVAMTPLGAIGSPLIGALADKYPTRLLYATGVVLLAILYGAISFASAPWMIIALYGTVAPIMLALCTAVTANAVIARWFVHRRGLALGLSSFGLGLGGVLLPPVIAALLPLTSWQVIWRAGAVLALALLPIVLLVMRDRPEDRDGTLYISGNASASSTSHHGGGGTALRFIDFMSRRTFWIAVAAFLVMIGLHGAVQMNLGPYAASHGFGERSGMLVAVLSLTQVLAALAMGLLSDRFGNRLPLIGLMIVVASGALLLAIADSFAVAVAGAALVGLAYGVFPVITSALAEEFGAEGVGRAFGLIMMFLPVIAPTAFGLAKIQETTGSYTPAFVVAAAVVLLVSVLCLYLPKRRAAPVQTA